MPKKNETSLKKIRNGKNPPEDDNFKIEMIDNVYQALDQFLLILSDKKHEIFLKTYNYFKEDFIKIINYNNG